MIIQCENKIEQNELVALQNQIADFGLKVTEVRTQIGTYLIALGSYDIDIRRVGGLRGVVDVHRVSDSYKLVSRKWKVAPSVIDLGDGVKIGDGKFSLMLGPCSLENEAQIQNVAQFLVKNGVRIMRGGAFKPRTSPYSFRGLGIEGLRMFSEIARPMGLKLITEIMDASQIEAMIEFVDIFQVGTRNAQNFTLLDELGKVDKPVMLKRGMSGTIEELLQAAERVFSNGNEKIILCERGIRTFETAYRNTFDINVVPILKEKTHLPVIIDPSHGIGVRRFVPQIALTGVVTGADGAIIEIHEKPERAASDGAQTLSFDETSNLLKKINSVRSAMFAE